MKRPTLAAHVAARLHRVAGETLVALHDSLTGAVACVGLREWTVLGCLDGSRDVDGVVAAAAALGKAVKRDHVVAFIAELSGAGMLHDGPLPPPDGAADSAARPLRPLDFRMRCDGSGSCCRIYPTTVFSSLEVARARTTAPDAADCGARPEQAFAPIGGSVARPWSARSVTMIDGRCAFLSPERRCVLHARGGAGAKPSGCAMFPKTFVDDGETVRVSVLPECRCVFVGSGVEGEPLLDAGMSTSADLDDAAHVLRLGDSIRLTASQSVALARYRELARALEAALADVDDAPSWLWQQAAQLDGQGSAAGPLLSAMLADWRGRLERQLQRAAWRHDGDLAKRVAGWMLAALPLIDVDERLASAQEHLYLCAHAHGHGWVVDEERPLVEAMRDSALRLWIARRLRAAMSPSDRADPDPALDTPIALVEAVSRGFGL